MNPLYVKLQNFFNSWIEDHDFSFVDRLAYENNWSRNYALRVSREYIKFIFLASISPKPITPSDQVDQAWHLHLQYCEKYNEMNSFLPHPVLHGPTKGGEEERDKFSDWYSYTKNLYLETFNIPPPDDIWTSNDHRFNIAPLGYRVNPRESFVMNKKFFYFLLTINLIIMGVLCLR